jgi:UrcA family protein
MLVNERDFEMNATNHMIAAIAAVAAAAGSIAFAGSASAATPVSVVKVSYADLDLNSDAGNAKLDARLRRATAKVCDSNGQAALANAVCRAKLMADARTQVAQIDTNVVLASR